MRNFTYQALTENEELRTGEIVAKSAAAALEELESQGLTVLLIRQADAVSGISGKPAYEPVAFYKTAGESLLHERVAQLLEKRETLGPALRAFAEELPKGRARRDLLALTRRIQNGASVAELTQPPALTNVWLPLIGSGSAIGAGHLQDIFAEAERDYANRSHIARTLAYPAILFCVSLGILGFLSIFIVPTFREIFDDFEINLPGLTLFVINFSHFLLHRPLEFLLIVVLVGLMLYGTIMLVRRWVLPGRGLGEFLNGNSQQVSEMARFVQHLAEALNAGLSLADALLVVGTSSKHRWLRRESLRLYDQLVSGSDSRAVFHDSILPATVNYALQAGPQRTPHVPLLQTIAETYFERVRNRFKWSSGFLPQVGILCIGILVAMVVLALYLPLVMLINGLTG
jgi:type IV pilus assembly protein PilC